MIAAAVQMAKISPCFVVLKRLDSVECEFRVDFDRPACLKSYGSDINFRRIISACYPEGFPRNIIWWVFLTQA